MSCVGVEKMQKTIFRLEGEGWEIGSQDFPEQCGPIIYILELPDELMANYMQMAWRS